METSVVKNNRYQIMTPTGWSDFDGVRKTTKTESLILILSDGSVLHCTTEHKVKLSSNLFVEARNLFVGDKLNGGHQVVDILHQTFPEQFYDALDVKKNNEYITNNVVSHNCEFLGSSDTLIRADVIQRLVAEHPVARNNNINIFEEPEEGHKYMITVDVSRGVNGDFSAFVVVDITQFPYRVVATFRDNAIEPVVYPNYIDYASRKYNDAAILVEVNDIGAQIADILNYELENENLLMVGSNGRSGQILGGGSTKPKFGVRTTPAVKRIGCFAFKGLIENDQLLVRDFEIISEISTFISNGKSYEADFGNHDDLVMCLVLFSWATTQKHFQTLADNDVRARILDIREAQIESNMSPFGVIDDKSGTPDIDLVDPFDHWTPYEKELMFDF